MQQQDIDVIDLQVLQALLDGCQELVVCEIVGVDLRRDAQLIAGNTGRLQGLAGFGFVAIHLGGVEGAIADFGRRQNGVSGHVAFQRTGADCALVGILKIDVHRCLPSVGHL